MTNNEPDNCLHPVVDDFGICIDCDDLVKPKEFDLFTDIEQWLDEGEKRGRQYMVEMLRDLAMHFKKHPKEDPVAYLLYVAEKEEEYLK